VDRQTTVAAAEPAPEASRRRWLAVPRFRRSLVTSAVVHLTLLATALALGLGPQAKEGRIWFSTALAVEHPESSEPTPLEDVEPEHEPEKDELPEPELTPVEVTEPPPEPLAEPEPELADVADLLWTNLSLEPLRRIEPPAIEQVSSEELAQADQSDPAANTAAEVQPTPTAPLIVAAPAPTYPRVSLRLGHEGEVLLRIHVSHVGAILEIELIESSGHERLDQAALDTVRAWTFRPATESGVAVAGTLLHRVVFRIDDAAGI
jgi:protein TonB